ncbi:MAG: transketolase [Deltaproteobacteria bacterium]|nr:transketolase [Deltaproteobacteria bacterium]
MHFESHVGHLGGNLSALDILLCLHHDVLGPSDAFVLSKGHSVGALYVALWSVGRLSDEDLRTFHRDGTRLAGHPPPEGIPDIPFATGSLGHGPALAAGLALARKLRGQEGRAYCLTSDGEWDEGSCWETVIFARQRQLANLTLIVDLNGLQGFGTTKEVADLDPLASRFATFGWSVREVSGHSPEELAMALKAPCDQPLVVLARTVKGRGVSFMENRMEWHYLPMSEAQYRQALAEVERS